MDYRELLLVRAARETGVLDAVCDGATTPSEVIERTDVTERAARITLAALEDIGLVTTEGDSYEPTDQLRGVVGSPDLHSMGSLPFQLDLLDRWIALPETMRRGEPPAVPDDWTEHYMASMATVDASTVRACVTGAVHASPGAERVVDLGGGPGEFAREFHRRGYDVTLFDRPKVIEIDQEVLDDEPIELVAGDLCAEIPGEYDLAFCSRVAQALSPAANRRLLAAVRNALATDGTLVLIELVRGRSSAAPMFGAHMLAQLDGGNTYTEAQYREWFTDAGFEPPRIEDVPGTPYQTVTANLS